MPEGQGLVIIELAKLAICALEHEGMERRYLIGAKTIAYC